MTFLLTLSKRRALCATTFVGSRDIGAWLCTERCLAAVGRVVWTIPLGVQVASGRTIGYGGRDAFSMTADGRSWSISDAVHSCRS